MKLHRDKEAKVNNAVVLFLGLLLLAELAFIIGHILFGWGK